MIAAVKGTIEEAEKLIMFNIIKMLNFGVKLR